MSSPANAGFLCGFVRSPVIVGAIVPSGEELASRIIAPIPHTGEPVVVELGPGTGAFTTAIQRRLAGRGHHLAIETNERFATRLAARFPGVGVVATDAGRLREVRREHGHRYADVIVSGLPWAAFAPHRQRDVPGSAVDVLRPDGAFNTFAYVHARWLPAAQRLRREL